ncbi:MAG: NADH-quinone oxidoreductase subunit C [Anaerolineae bacterium]|jgi:NADH-quinone oxidoreductase subunit C|nr:NADH-quinone oxidoreductase subunit C [Anaerolineae bacterium]
MNISRVLSALNARFHVPYSALETIHHETMIPIAAKDLHEVVALLQNKLHIMHLTTITAQITAENPDEILVYYHFWDGDGFTFAINLPVQDPQLPSVIDLIPGADFYEREVAEMYGIHFSGRTNTPPLLLPDDWEGDPPMRRKEKNDD